MKKSIHPQYYPESQIICACGNKFKVGATLPEIRVEICGKCHPFYTGKEKLIDTAGRVEKFRRKESKKQSSAAEKKKPAKK